MTTPSSNLNQVRTAAVFVTTRWSVVLAAGLDSSDESAQALAFLCRSYWYPLYTFLRRQGYSPPDAEDLTQGFFAHLLNKNAFQKVAPDRGKFRSFLLAALKNFVANEWDRQHAAKRGGKQSFISLDDDAEARYRREPSHDASPEKIFEQTWALTVLNTVLQRLRREYADAGKSQLFETLQEQLIGEDDVSYSELAAQLAMKEGAVRMAVMRMRRHFGYLLRAEIAHTVAHPEELEGELRHLIATIAG